MRIVSIFIMVALAGASVTGAQTVHTKAAGGTVAGIAPAPVAPAPTAPRTHERRFLAGNTPVVLLDDGRVFADFGRGYEQVVRACRAPATYSQPVLQPTVVQPPVGGSQSVVPAPAMSDLSCWSSDERGQIAIARP